MKNLLLLTLLTLALPSAAYQTLESSKAQFGASAQTEQTTSSADSNSSSTRTFSTYQSRQHNWNKGVQTTTVQTKTVQTHVAGQEPPTAAEPPAAQAAAALKKATAAPNPTASPSGQVGKAPKINASHAPVSLRGDKPADKPADKPTEQPAAPVDPMAEMQKALGGNADMIKALTGGAMGGNPAQGGALPNGGAMPDISALLGGSQPKK